MLKSTQCKNLRIYFYFPQSLTDEQDHNYCTTEYFSETSGSDQGTP